MLTFLSPQDMVLWVPLPPAQVRLTRTESPQRGLQEPPQRQGATGFVTLFLQTYRYAKCQQYEEAIKEGKKL